VVVGGCAAHYGPVDYYLGTLAAALGDYSRAAQQVGTEGSMTMSNGRKSVSARIRDVLSRITIAHPALGSHLNESALLGVRCSYPPNEPIRWDLGRPAVGSRVVSRGSRG
jgi:hypothetical protein